MATPQSALPLQLIQSGLPVFGTYAGLILLAKVIPMTFIRTPCIDSVSENIQISAQADGHIAVARQGEISP